MRPPNVIACRAVGRSGVFSFEAPALKTETGHDRLGLRRGGVSRGTGVQIEIEADSLVGAGSFFEGSFAVKGNMRIDGKFEGRALEVDQLQIGPTGKVRTDIHATSVVIEGMVLGNISADRRILLLSTARVLGDIKTPELIIQDGVVLEGTCTIGHTEIDNTREYLQSLYDKKG